MDFIINLVAFILSLGVIVALHELGHFFFAKRASILCYEYAIGMGPIVYSKRKGETLYSIRAIPIGGFVSMAGEQLAESIVNVGDTVGLNFKEDKVSEIILDAHMNASKRGKVVSLDLYDKESKGLYIELELEGANYFFNVSESAFYKFTEKKSLQVTPYHRSFESKTLWQRFLTILGGPLMNFVLAFFLLLIVASIQGKPSNQSIIGDLVANGVAESAGLLPNDKIIKINDIDITNWTDVGTALSTFSGETVVVTILRDESEMDITLTPRVDINAIGLSNFNGATIETSTILGAAIGSSFGKASDLLTTGDVVTEIRFGSVTYTITSWSDLVDAINSENGGNMEVTFIRNNTTESVTYEAWENNVLSSQGVSPVSTIIGIEPTFHFDILYTIQYGFTGIWSSIEQVIAVLGLLFGGSSQIGLNDLSGPVGIFNIVGQYAKAGFVSFIWFVAFLSVNIGVMNLLPIPALDGGRLVFLAAEGIMRRPLNRKLENTLNNVMFILLLLLFVYVTFFDVMRMF